MKFDSFDDKNIDIELEEKEKPGQGNNQPHLFNKVSNQKENPTNEPSNKMFEDPKDKETTEYNTLDETACATLKRDLMKIYHKLKHVLIPTFSSTKNEELQNWDLWGPLLICLGLCIFLSVGRENKTHMTFIAIFIIIWLGGTAIAFNSIFLGAKTGICQSICLLGYCTFPTMVASIFIKIFSWAPPYAKLIIVSITFIWSCFSSVGFMSSLVPQSKKFVAVYPVFLFYLTLSGFVLNY